jgi:hypothetical protein
MQIASIGWESNRKPLISTVYPSYIKIRNSESWHSLNKDGIRINANGESPQRKPAEACNSAAATQTRIRSIIIGLEVPSCSATSARGCHCLAEETLSRGWAASLQWQMADELS